MKSIYDNLPDIIFGKSDIRFEEKLLLSSTLIIALFQFLSIFFNLIIGLKPSIIIVSIIGFLIFLTLYFAVRFVSRSTAVFLISGFVMLIFCDLVWFVNYGSWGPSIFFFIVLYSFLILLFQRKHYFLITSVLILNLIGFLILEYFFPDFIGNYANSESRLTDTYTGSVLTILILLTLLSVIKKNYIQEFERAKKSDELKSAFVANMSHEIRTPLNAIVGFSSLMSDPEISNEDKLTFEILIQKNSDYLLHLIQDIIDVSKIESNQLGIKVREIDIVPVINQIVESFQLSLPADTNLKIVSNLDESRIIILVDQLRMEQVLRNLVSNALKFTEKGIVEIGCKKGTGNYTFWVKDSGIGIDPDYQKIIFDRFMKIDNDKQHLYRGTGIGLFISKQLVEMFKGKIWVESENGKGSTFFFTIPI